MADRQSPAEVMADYLSNVECLAPEDLVDALNTAGYAVVADPAPVTVQTITRTLWETVVAGHDMTVGALGALIAIEGTEFEAEWLRAALTEPRVAGVVGSKRRLYDRQLTAARGLRDRTASTLARVLAWHGQYGAPGDPHPYAAARDPEGYAAAMEDARQLCTELDRTRRTERSQT